LFAHVPASIWPAWHAAAPQQIADDIIGLDRRTALDVRADIEAVSPDFPAS